ncbi:MAG TPA: hypothetical protein VFZ64_08305 [Nocardioidaceae bacterium]
MGDTILTILFWLGVVMIGAFVVAGLASPRVRTMLQRPADDMVRRDRERWGSGTTDEGDQR